MIRSAAPAAIGVALGVALAACGPRSRGRSAEAPAPSPAPRIVVLVAYDQLPDWAVDLHLPRLAPDGLIRRAIADGRRFRGEYQFAATLTAPAHATMVTGALPAEHGVLANSVWSATRGKEISVYDDGEHAIYGRDGAFASAAALRLPVVADVLRAHRGASARVVSLSLKDRSGIALAGRTPDLALWYDRSARGFVTSTCYGDMPAWATAYQSAHPLIALLVPWQVDDAAALAAALGPDRAPGESMIGGVTPEFPHDPNATEEPWGFLRAMPQLGEYLVDLTLAAVDEYHLGDDGVPDLLAVAMSTTDYTGHLFGPESWEYADALRRVDRALGRMIDRLAARAPIAVIVVSDHGVAPLVEAAQHRGHRAGRLNNTAIARALDDELDRRRGAGDWVAAFVSPYVYLGRDGEAHRAEVMPVVLAELRAHPGVALAIDTAQVPAGVHAGTPESLVAASIPAHIDGDVYVLPQEWWVMDPDEAGGMGTGHGTSWSYDRQVPLLVFGSGIAPNAPATPEIVDPRRIAPTLAALLGIPASAQPEAWRDLALLPGVAPR